MATISGGPSNQDLFIVEILAPAHGRNLISFLEVKYFWKKFSTVVASIIFPLRCPNKKTVPFFTQKRIRRIKSN